MPILKRMSHLSVGLSDEPVKLARNRAYKKELSNKEIK
jgi:hypothetical protein